MRLPFGAARLRHLLVLAFALAFAAASAFDSADELSRWMSLYYQAPEPQRLGEALRQFVAEPARLVQPERLDAPAQFFGVLARSSPSAREAAVAFDQSLPAGPPKQFVERVLRQSGKLEFTRARDPNDIDIVWAQFAATGDLDAVRIVVAALDFSEREVDLSRPIWKAIKVKDRPEGARLMRSAAAWSLAKHAQMHPRVNEQLQKNLAGAKTEAQRAQLRGILDGRISLK